MLVWYNILITYILGALLYNHKNKRASATKKMALAKKKIDRYIWNIEKITPNRHIIPPNLKKIKKNVLVFPQSLHTPRYMEENTSYARGVLKGSTPLIKFSTILFTVHLLM